MKHFSPCPPHRSDWLCVRRQLCCPCSHGIWGRRAGHPGAGVDQSVLESNSPERRWETQQQLWPKIPACRASSPQDPGNLRWPVPAPLGWGHYFSASSTWQSCYFCPPSLAQIAQIHLHCCDLRSLHSVCPTLVLFPAPKGHTDTRVSHWVQLRH